MPIVYFLLAQLLGLAIFQFIPKSLNTVTSIIGYPIHANFNIDYYYAFYFIELFVVAPLGLFLFHRYSENKNVLPERAQSSDTPYPKIVYYGLVPLLIFYVFSQVAGSRSWIHLYHDAESVLTSQFLQQGLFPWRDFVFTHGLLQDPLMALLGHTLFENTVWGADLGVALIWIPLFNLTWYFLHLKLYSKSKSLLWILIFILPFLFPVIFNRFNLRFLFFPLILLASYGFFAKPKKLSAFLLGVLLVMGIFLTPELVLYGVCLAVCLGLFHLSRNKKKVNLVYFAVGVFVPCLMIGWVLYFFGALAPFLKVYTEEGLHYRYESGIPLMLNLGSWYVLAFSIPALCFFIGNFYFYSSYKRDKGFSPLDWMLLSYHIFSVLYYAKLLCRADAHVLAHSGVALPLLIYFILQFRWISRPWIQFTALSIFVYGASSLWPHLNPGKFRLNTEAKPSKWAKFGLHEDNRVSDEIISDLEELFKPILHPGDKIFDFTNEPLLFHYLLGLGPATRFPYVIMAATRETQERLVADLEKNRPKWVIYASQLDYASWDGVPFMVRHYEVSRYLLKNYKKLRSFKHHVILQRHDLNFQYPEEVQSAFQIEACDWGYAPSFLKEFQTSGDRNLPFKTEKLKGGYVTEIRLSSLQIDKDSVIELEFTSSQRDAVSLYGPEKALGIQFKILDRKNYKMTIPVASCPQWWSYQGDVIRMVHHQPQAIFSIRLKNLSPPKAGISFAIFD